MKALAQAIMEAHASASQSPLDDDVTPPTESSEENHWSNLDDFPAAEDDEMGEGLLDKIMRRRMMKSR